MFPNHKPLEDGKTSAPMVSTTSLATTKYYASEAN